MLCTSTAMAEPETLDNVQNTTLSSDRKSELISYIICQKDAFFKSQQRDEADLSNEEKAAIVGKLFDTDQSMFLSRYGKYLDESYLNFILDNVSDPKKDDHIVMQIEALKEKDRDKKSRVKNRRYNALQKMLHDGSSYFSNSEMQSRDPYLFEQMIGQYMDENQRKELQNASYFENYGNTNFSSFMFEQIRNFQLNCRYNKQQEEEEVEEDEDDEEEDVDEEEEDREENTANKSKISNEKKQQLENEFVVQMKENFLSGKDKDHFDYSSVDDNEDYDMSRVSEQDAQDRYFDESD